MSNRHIGTIWIAAAFLDDFVLIYPTYALMMLEEGLSGTELSLLFAAWSVSALLFEVPSGVLGDLLNRKRYLAGGSFVRGAGYLCWLVLPGWSGFLGGFLLWSLGSAIHSGTLQALLHDVLCEQGREEEFSRVYGRGVASGSVGVLLAMALGGYAAQGGYTPVLVLSALAPILGGLLILLGIAEPAPSTAEKPARPLATLQVAARALGSNRQLLLPVLMCVAFMGAAGVVDEYLGPLLRESGVLALGPIGVLYGSVLGARALGAAQAHRLQRLSLTQLGLLSLAAHGVLVLGTLAPRLGPGDGLGPVSALVGAAAAYYAVLGAVGVLLESEVQRRIDVGARATVASLAGAGIEIWGVSLYLLIGTLADLHDWASAIAAAAVLCMALAGALTYVAGPVTARRRS